MAFEKIHFLPIISVCLLVSTVALTFVLCCVNKHVTHFPLFISDTGAHPPESCIFAQMLNVVAFLTSVPIYVKYRQLREIISKNDLDNLQRPNKICLIFGLIAVLSMSFVGNFQETNAILVHFTSAMFTFGFGTLYQCLQTTISKNLRRGSCALIGLKIALSIVSAITFLLFFIGSCIFVSTFKGEDITKWTPSDGLAELYYVCTISEWICAAAMSGFILTLAHDLVHVCISEPIVILSAQNTLNIF